MSQSVLRRGIEELKITVGDDPRVAIMQMERYAERLDPKMTSKEMSEQLMTKLPTAWKHIATTIKAVVRDLSDYSGKHGVKEMFIATLATWLKHLGDVSYEK